MRVKQLLFALAVVVVLGMAAPRGEAQMIGGYIGFGSPSVVGYGAPLVAPAPVLAAPVVPYATAYPVVGVSPWFGPRPVYYGPGWGYRPGFYGSRVVYPRPMYGYGRRWW
ncbi:MAG: hypothetical protein U0790_09720 [Isosphaeraceae bacterium]